MSDSIRAAQVSQDVVTEGVAALRAFGADLTLTDAMKLLPMWKHAARLDAAQRAAILGHFTGAEVTR